MIASSIVKIALQDSVSYLKVCMKETVYNSYYSPPFHCTKCADVDLATTFLCLSQ